MPPLQKKNKFKWGFKKWSDDTTIRLRKELELLPSSALCAFDLCNHLNIPIFEPNMIKGLDAKKLNHLLNEGSSDWSAATIPLGVDKNIIIHNTQHSAPRQQSNLMHELAHILCEHKVPSEIINLGLSGFLRHHNEEQENEANWLGACLQLPRPALLWALKKEMSEEDISTHFNASAEMVRYRINITGVRKQLFFRRKK